MTKPLTKTLPAAPWSRGFQHFLSRAPPLTGVSGHTLHQGSASTLWFLFTALQKHFPSLSEAPPQKSTHSEVSSGHPIEFGVSAFSNESQQLSENLRLSHWEPGYLSTSRRPCTRFHHCQDIGLCRVQFVFANILSKVKRDKEEKCE